MIDAEQNHCFNKLSLNSRSAYRYNWLSRKDRGAFRHSPHVTAKFEVLQILQEFRVKNILGSQIVDIFLCKPKLGKVFHQLFNTSHNGKPAVIRNLSEKHVKITDSILELIGKIPIRHGKLIKIGQHGEILFSIKTLTHF